MANSVSKQSIIYNLSENGKIKGYKWFDQKNEKNKGVVVICHGMAEHIDRYDDFCTKLVNNGYIVYGHNQRGHKESINSDDDYGFMSENDNFEILVKDLFDIIEKIKKDHQEKPIYLFGHSMGSFVSQRLIQEHPKLIDGLILSGSSKNPTMIVSLGLFISRIIALFKGKHYRSNLIDSMSFGAYNKKFKPNRTKFDWLNQDEAEVDKYINDKYCGGVFTTGYFKDFFKGLNKITRNNKLISKDLPILLISGSKDPVGGMSKGITNLYETYKDLQLNDVELKLYENARHEILLETMKEEVITDIINWLKKH